MCYHEWIGHTASASASPCVHVLSAPCAVKAQHVDCWLGVVCAQGWCPLLQCMCIYDCAGRGVVQVGMNGCVVPGVVRFAWKGWCILASGSVRKV